MLDCLLAARAGSVPLVQAADTLLFLRDALEVADEEWSSAFTSHIATLESAGLVTAEQKAKMGAGFERAVSTALAALQALIRRHPGADTVP